MFRMSLVILNSPWGLWQLCNSDEPLKDKRWHKSFWTPPGADICRKLKRSFPAMLLQQHLLNVINLGVQLHLEAPAYQPNSPWCGVIPVLRDTSRAGASLESRSGGGRRDSRMEVSLCHSSAAPTWGWLGSLLLPREKIRLRGLHVRTKREAACSACSACQPAGQRENTDFQT